MAEGWSRVQVKPAAPRLSHDVENDNVAQQQQTLDRRRKSRAIGSLERDQPFSWTRCAVSIVSYGLLLSDVFRSGPGIRELPKNVRLLEPDAVVYVGPVEYSTNHLTRENATMLGSGRLWPYKYDTTSIAMRAFAEHLQLPSWSPCLLYHERCDETHGLPLLNIFNMVGSLVEAMEEYASDTSQRDRTITLRVDSVLRDRLHHFVLPWFYETTVKRTVQATYYTWDNSQSSSTVVCNAIERTRPYTCAETWAHRLLPTCMMSQPACRSARSVWRHIPKRIRFLKKVYPGMKIDSVIIDGTDDYSRGGLTYQGRRRAEVVLFSRIQSCVNNMCVPVAVDDYRFEGNGFAMNVSHWLSIVGLLRVVAQLYTWVRMFLLVWICHVARRNASRQYRLSSRLVQCRTVIRTIFLIPSQVVIYGSLCPIALYYVAHLIDSPASYALVSLQFNTLFGKFTWDYSDFFKHCAISMRTVWALSVQCHVIQAAFTRRVWVPAHGIPGVPEFIISFVASLTILAEYRALMFRDTRVLSMYEISRSTRVHQLRSYPHDGHRNGVNSLLLGTTTDWRCLQFIIVMVLCICAALAVMNRVFPRCFPFRVSVMSRTLVPYSAGFLWPRNRLVVCWFGSLLSTTSTDASSNAPFRRKAQAAQLQAIAMPAMIHGTSQRSGALRFTPDRGLVLRNTAASLQAQRELQSSSSRSREIQSAVYVMNLAMMTDPITMLRLRFFSGQLIGLYTSTVTHQNTLLPYAVKASNGDIPIDWDELELVAVLNTKTLAWDDLLRCG